MARFKSLRRLIGCSSVGLILGLLLASNAWAEIDMSIFAVSPMDKSKEYLGTLFGPVGNLGLVGISPVFGNIFGLFNGIVLSLTTLIVGYITVSGAVHTAQEGEVLGKKWSMILIPTRAALGMYLLIPDSTGFSGIQVFFMWMVLNGVGAANTMWEMLIDKIKTGESVADSADNEIVAEDRANVAQIFTILVCQEFINDKTSPISKAFRTAQDISPTFEMNVYPATTKAGTPYDRIISGSSTSVNTPSGTLDMYDKTCGSVVSPDYSKVLAKLAPDDLKKVRSGIVGNTVVGGIGTGVAGLTSGGATAINAVTGGINDAAGSNANIGQVNSVSSGTVTNGLSSVSGGINTVASSVTAGSIETIYDIGADLYTLAPVLQRQMVEALLRITDMLQPYAKESAVVISDPKTTPDQQNAIIDDMMPAFNQAVVQYSKIIKQGDPTSYQDENTTDKVVTSAKKNGWIFAGSYYYKLVKASASGGLRKHVIAEARPDINVVDSLAEAQKSFQPFGMGAGDTVFDRIFSRTGSFQAKLITANKAQQAGPPTAATLQMGKRTVKDTTNGGLAGFVAAFNKVRDKFLKDTENIMLKNSVNPIASVASLGSSIIFICDISFLTMIVVTLGITVVAFVNSCAQPAGYAFRTAIKLIYPVIALLISTMYAAGMMMAVYLPLIPYLIYTFATIGWIFAVTEAMIAAPLVAMSIAVPAEDELGKASHSLLLLTNLFLRPTFIVIGLIAGARLLIVSIEMVTFGFRSTVTEMVGTTGMFGIVPMIVMYSTLITTIANKSFSIIYLLPDHVVRWLGGQAEGFGEGDLLSQAKEGTDKASQATGKAAGGVVSGAGGIAEGAVSKNTKKK